MQPADVLRIAHAVDAAGEREELDRVFTREARAVGAEWATCTVFPRRPGRHQRPQILIGAVPRAWKEHYDTQQDWDHDPILLHARQSLMPFRWKQALTKRPAGRAAEVMQSRADFGLKDGLVVPIFTPRGDLGWAHFQGSGLSADPKDASLLRLLGICAFGHAIALDAAAPAPAGPSLSPREIECLRWIADGKSEKDIAVILDVTARTVHFHVENAKRKFLASTRTQAVVEAVRSGVLGL